MGYPVINTINISPLTWVRAGPVQAFRVSKASFQSLHGRGIWAGLGEDRDSDREKRAKENGNQIALIHFLGKIGYR